MTLSASALSRSLFFLFLAAIIFSHVCNRPRTRKAVSIRWYRWPTSNSRPNLLSVRTQIGHHEYQGHPGKHQL
jgi:hypothetical protein